MNSPTAITILLLGVGSGWLLRGLVEPDSGQPPPQPVLQQAKDDNAVKRDLNVVITIDTPPLKSAEDNRLDVLLQNGRDNEALEWYASKSDDAIHSRKNYQSILAHVKKREIEGDVAAAIRLLGLLIEQLPQAFDARIMLATLYGQQQRFYQQLTTLFNAQAIASSALQLTQLDHLIQQAVKEAEDVIGDTDTDAKIELYEFLIQQRAAHTPYYIELATLLIKESRLERASEVLNVVQYDPFVGQAASEMREEIEQLRLQALETPIPLGRRGSHFLVGVTLNYHEYNLMIDTGASLTVLSGRAARALGLHESNAHRRQLVNTANGTTEALLYRLESMTIGLFSVSPIEIAVVEQLEVSGASGLLGMNFLQHFEFRIDQQQNQLFLTYRE